MKLYKRSLVVGLGLVALAFAAVVAPPAVQERLASAVITQAHAATPNVTPGAGQVVVLPFHFSGQYVATTAAVTRFSMPFPCYVLGAGASARASGGTTPTLTVDLKSGGTSILSAAIAVTAGAYAEGTVSTPAIADEAAITVDLTIAGTTPTWNDITLMVTCARL